MSPAIPSPPCLFGGVASLPPTPFCASHHTYRLRHCKSNNLNNPNNRTILPSQPLAAFAAIRRRRGRRRRHWRWLRVYLSLTVCRVRGESRAFLLRAIFAVVKRLFSGVVSRGKEAASQVPLSGGQPSRETTTEKNP